MATYNISNPQVALELADSPSGVYPTKITSGTEEIEFAESSLWALVHVLDGSTYGTVTDLVLNGTTEVFPSDFTTCATTVTGGVSAVTAYSGQTKIAGGETINVSSIVYLDNDEVAFNIKVEQSGSTGGSIFATRYPSLDVKNIHRTIADKNKLIYCDRGGRLISDPGIYGNTNGINPSFSASMQFMALYNVVSKDMLYLQSKDSEGYRKDLATQALGTETRMFFTQYPENNIVPNITYESPYEVRMAFLSGTWYDAARRYRAWATQQPWASNGKLTSDSTIPNKLKSTLLMDTLTTTGENPDVMEKFAERGKLMKKFFSLNDDEELSLWWRWWQPPAWSLGDLTSGWPDEVSALSTFSAAVDDLQSTEVLVGPYIPYGEWDTSTTSYVISGIDASAVKNPDESVAKASDFSDLVITEKIVSVAPSGGDKTIISDNTTNPTSPLLDGAADLVVGEANNILYISNDKVPELIRLNVDTGVRNTVSDNDDTGPDIQTPAGIIYDAGVSFDSLLYTDITASSIVRADITTGNRGIVSDGTTGSGRKFERPIKISRTVESPLTVPMTACLVLDTNIPALMEVDLSSGDRTDISYSGLGTGANFNRPTDLILDSTTSSIYVTDRGANSILKVDYSTGDRTVLSGDSVGSGELFQFPAGIALDKANNRLLVTDRLTKALLGVNLTTGDRSLLSSPWTGSGLPFNSPNGLDYVSASGLVYIANGHTNTYHSTFNTRLDLSLESSRDVVTQAFVDLLQNENDFDAFYWDVWTGSAPEFCFDQSHSHPLGGGKYFSQGKLLSTSSVNSGLKNINPQHILTSEHINEFYMENVDLTFSTALKPFQIPEIPLFQTVYHDYTITSDLGATLDFFLDSYLYPSKAYLSYNLGLGKLPSARGGLIEKTLQLKEPFYLSEAFIVFSYLKSMVDCYRRYQKYLLYGERRRSLAGSYEEGVELGTFTPGPFLPVNSVGLVPSVFSSVWKDTDGNLGIIFTNHSDSDQVEAFTVSLAEYGLVGEFMVTETSEKSGTQSLFTTTSDFSSTLSVPANSWSVVELVDFSTASFIEEEEDFGVSKPVEVTHKLLSKTQANYGVSYPLGKLDPGPAFKKSSGLRLEKQKLQQLLKTEKGERIMLPNFGLRLRQFVFQPLDQFLFSEIAEEISTGLALYAPNLELIKVRIVDLGESGKSDLPGLQITVTAKIKDEDNLVFDTVVRIGE